MSGLEHGDYMDESDCMDQVKDAVGVLLAQPPLKRPKPESDPEDRPGLQLKGKGRGKGRGKNRDPEHPLQPTTTAGSPATSCLSP